MKRHLASLPRVVAIVAMRLRYASAVRAGCYVLASLPVRGVISLAANRAMACPEATGMAYEAISSVSSTETSAGVGSLHHAF